MGEHNAIDPESLQQKLKTISRNGWRIAEIVRALNIYVSGDSQKMDEYTFNELVHDTLLLLEHQLASWSNIKVVLDLAENLPTLRCNQNSITQIMINLLTNARDAMPHGGDIIIHSGFDPQSQRLILKVSDSGKGIPPNIQPKIFDPFYTTKPIGEGVGLGLSIVMGIVRSYGGEIVVDSQLRKGTTFTLFFPLNYSPRVDGKAPVVNVGRYDDSVAM